MPAGEVEVGHIELRLDVERAVGGCGPCRLQIEALNAVEQPHLAETRERVRVPRVLRERLLVRRDGGRVVADLDRRERLSVQRGSSGSTGGSGSAPSSPTESDPVTPFCAATCSSCAKTSRTCCSGTAPVNIGTG